MPRPTTRPAFWAEGCAAVGFFTIWTGGLLFGVGSMVRQTWQADRAIEYPTATATVFERTVQVPRRRADTERSLRVRYAYHVDGRRYTTNDRHHTVLIAEADDPAGPHSIGSSTGVAYNPDDPNEVHFRVGVERFEPAGLWMVVGMISLGLGAFVPGTLLHRLPAGFDPRNPADVRRTRRGWAAALPPLRRLTVAHAAVPITCAVTFAALLLTHRLTDWVPPIEAQALWVPAAVGLVMVAVRRFALYPELLVERQSVLLPSVRYWRKPLTVPRAKVIAVRAYRFRRRMKNGRPNADATPEWAVAVAYRDGRGRVQATAVAVYDHRHDAEALAAWAWWARVHPGERGASAP